MKIKEMSSKSYFSLIKALFIAGLALALFFVVIFAAGYESDVHYFKLYSAAPVVYAVLMCVLCIACLAAILFAPTEELFSNGIPINKRSVFSRFASIFCAIAVIACVVPRFNRLAIVKKNGVSTPGHPFQKQSFLLIAFIVFGLLTAGFFIANFLKTSRTLRVYLGMAVIAFLLVYILTVYYDTNIPINSSMRVMNQVTTIFLLLWFLFEERFIVRMPKPRFYVSTSIVAVSLALALSLSTLFVLPFKKANTEDADVNNEAHIVVAGTIINDDIAGASNDPSVNGTFATVGALMQLSFAIWITTRMASYVSILKVHSNRSDPTLPQMHIITVPYKTPEKDKKEKKKAKHDSNEQ